MHPRTSFGESALVRVSSNEAPLRKAGVVAEPVSSLAPLLTTCAHQLDYLTALRRARVPVQKLCLLAHGCLLALSHSRWHLAGLLRAQVRGVRLPKHRR